MKSWNIIGLFVFSMILTSLSFAGLFNGKEPCDPGQYKGSKVPSASSENPTRVEPKKDKPADKHSKKGRGISDGRGFDSDHRSRHELDEECTDAASAAPAVKAKKKPCEKNKAMRGARAERTFPGQFRRARQRDIEEQMAIELEYYAAEAEQADEIDDYLFEVDAENEAAADAAPANSLFVIENYDLDFPPLPRSDYERNDYHGGQEDPKICQVLFGLRGKFYYILDDSM